MKACVYIWVNRCLKHKKIKIKNNRPYINHPFREPEVIPWNTTHLGLVCSQKETFNTIDGTKLSKYISALNSIYSNIYCTEMVYIKYKSSSNTSRGFEDNWI